MNRKYLDDIGLTNRPDTWASSDANRMSKWKKEQETYGFDSRETWSLDITFILWVYEHLMMFKENADLYIADSKYVYKGEEHLLLETIDAILEKSKACLHAGLTEDNYEKNVREIGEMWTAILPKLWW